MLSRAVLPECDSLVQLVLSSEQQYFHPYLGFDFLVNFCFNSIYFLTQFALQLAVPSDLPLLVVNLL